MKCKHDWVVLDKTILESPFEQILKWDYEDLIGKRGTPTGDDLYRKKALVIVVCRICGKKEEHFMANPCEVD